MNRNTFLALAASIPLAGVAGPSVAADVDIPAELRGGRFFAVPRLPDGRVFACWVDTNGSGFVFDWALGEYGIAAEPGPNGQGRTAHLPDFDPRYTIPKPLLNDGRLIVFEMSGGDRGDPILRGFPAQLGGTWLANRVWRFDFPNAKLTMLATSLSHAQTTAYLGFDNLYPQVQIVIGGAPLSASFDTAATVSYVRERAGDGPQLQAASFVARGLCDAWRTSFPTWPVDLGVSTRRGVDRIIVPEVTIGTVTLRDVAFTTRPDDDVFAGTATQVKIGSNAFAGRVVTIDYPNGRLRIA